MTTFATGRLNVKKRTLPAAGERASWPGGERFTDAVFDVGVLVEFAATTAAEDPPDSVMSAVTVAHGALLSATALRNLDEPLEMEQARDAGRLFRTSRKKVTV